MRLIAIAVLVLSLLAGCRGGARVDDAGRPSASGVLLPADLGVGTGVAVVLRGSGPVRLFSRGDDPDRVSAAEDLVDVVTLLAALRTGVIDEHTVHHCNGLNCTRAHGDVTPGQALAVSCLHFFDDLGTRVGGDALAPAFLALGVSPPAIPSDRESRTRLAARGEGWSLSPRQALSLARGMRDRSPPWSPALETGVVPAVGDPGPLRGKTAGTGEISGWFVGYTTERDHALVAVRVSRCVDACAVRALVVARWAVAQRTTR